MRKQFPTTDLWSFHSSSNSILLRLRPLKGAKSAQKTLKATKDWKSSTKQWQKSLGEHTFFGCAGVNHGHPEVDLLTSFKTMLLTSDWNPRFNCWLLWHTITNTNNMIETMFLRFFHLRNTTKLKCNIIGMQQHSRLYFRNDTFVLSFLSYSNQSREATCLTNQSSIIWFQLRLMLTGASEQQNGATISRCPNAMLHNLD